MSKQAVSVTLDRDNLLWLRARTRALKGRSLSETLDRLVAEARERAGSAAEARRSVVGTITIAPSDPDLSGADAAIRALFAASVGESHRQRTPRAARSTRAGKRAVGRRG